MILSFNFSQNFRKNSTVKPSGLEALFFPNKFSAFLTSSIVKQATSILLWESLISSSIIITEARFEEINVGKKNFIIALNRKHVSRYLFAAWCFISYGSRGVWSEAVPGTFIYIFKKVSGHRMHPTLCSDYRAVTEVSWEKVWINCCRPENQK